MIDDLDLDIDEDKLYDFGIYETEYGTLRAQIQIEKVSYSKCFETREECREYIKDKLGIEEYNKRRYFAYNKNYYEKIEPSLTSNQRKIMTMLNKELSNISFDGNSNRECHIKKYKSITTKDLYKKVCEKKWCCYFSNLEFSVDKDYLKPSIDRLDCSVYYTDDNTVIVIQFVQYLKNSYSLEEFKRGIISIATNNFVSNVSDTRNNLIGGHRDKKGIKSWKQIILHKPIHMSPIQTYIYEILHNSDLWKTNLELRTIIEETYKKKFSKSGMQHALNVLEYREYLSKNTRTDIYQYKLKTAEQITAINKVLDIVCGNCKQKFNILHYRARDNRSRVTQFNCNLLHTVCTSCNTSHVTKSMNREAPVFIWRQISQRHDKLGDINKDNTKELITKHCAISGLPLIYERNSGYFNQASPDRINSSGKYDLNNTRIICLMLNLGKNKYDITDDEIMNIIRSINSHYFIH